MTKAEKLGLHALFIKIIPYLGFILLVLGAKFILITYYANATPFWDQWDAEADLLYRPWMEGKLEFSSLFGLHNEHRIFTAKAFGLVLFELNGRIWDPILQMQANAILHVMALCFLLYFTTQKFSRIIQTFLFIFSAPLFSIPYAWENTLVGFQSQWYFLLFFSFIYLYYMARYKPFTTWWWLGFFCGVLSVFSLASGVISLLAGVLVLGLRFFYERTHGRLFALAIFLLLSICFTTLFFTPSLAHHASLKAQFVSQFLKAIQNIAAWPSYKREYFIIQLPLFIFSYCFLRSKLEKTARNYFIFALVLWCLGQFVALSYGRAVGATSSRYLDFFVIGLFVNLVCFIVLIETSQRRKLYLYACAFWLVFIAFSFSRTFINLTNDLQMKAHLNLEQEKNTRAYLADGDFSHLENKPFLHIPYPDARRLKSLLDNPTITAILPGNLVPSHAEIRPSPFKRMMNRIAKKQIQLTAIGIALLLISILFAAYPARVSKDILGEEKI